MSQVLIPNDWKLCQVKDYIQKIEKRNPVFDPETEFKYVEIGSINTEDKIVESYSKVLGRKASTRARNVIRTNDVIYATTRPYYRNTALVPPHLDNQICSTGFCVLRVKDPEKLDPKFLFYFLQSDHGSNQIAISIRGGSYPAVTNNDIFKILIPLPSIEKQRQITRKLDNI